MPLRIFHRNVYLLLLVLTLLVCFGVGTSYANALAQKVYTKHRPVLARDDVQAALPTMLEQLGTLAVQQLLTPASILLAVENPELLKPVVPDTSPEFIAAMKEDAALQKLLQDADFQELLQTPAAIDALVTLIREGGDGLTDGVSIQAFTSVLELPMRRFELTPDSFTIGDTFQIDTTHNFVFTVVSADGAPVPWLPIRFNAVYMDGTAADLTFAPATTKTNQNGKVRTNITFRGAPGAIRLIAAVDRSQLVAFLAPRLVRNASRVADVAVKGIETGFAGLGTKRTLVFTATDANADPISGIALSFGFQSDANRQATATFLPATATTDENGAVQTRVTFGTTPGDLRIVVNAAPDTSPEVFIPDVGLHAAIRFELNLVEGDAVTEQKMQQLTHLAAPGGTEEKIADLTGLEHAVNLTFLTLGFNEISDISPLGNLTSLTDLNLGFNEIVDISAVWNLTNLTVLTLVENQIIDVSPLENLTNLTNLEIQGNAITDFAPLRRLTAQNPGLSVDTDLVDADTSPEVFIPDAGLRAAIRFELNLVEGDAVTEQKMQQLTHLAAPPGGTEEKIADLTGLEHAVNLTFLTLGFNEIVDISPLGNLTSLTDLNLGFNEIVDISAVWNLTNLTVLTLVENQIIDVSPLENLTNLTNLEIQGNAITDFAPLRRLTAKNPGLSIDTDLVDADTSPEVFIPDAGLRAAIRFELNLVEGDAVTEQKMQQLTHLAAPGGTEEKIADLTGLEHAVNLTFLTLGFNEIVDISPLGNLTSLTDLNLGFNEIVDISAVWNLTNLTVLTLVENQIIDVSPLENLTNLTNLEIQGNAITDFAPLRRLTAQNPGLSVDTDLVDADTSPEVFIPDAGLRAAIRFELNLVEGDAVTEQKMQQLTHLAAPGGTEEKIADLTGLEHAVNLTFLTLGFNEIVDISPLGNLTSLTDLNLGFNEIVDISAVWNLTNLTVLTLVENQIIDVSPLENLTNLTNLEIQGNAITDFAPLRRLTAQNPGLSVDTDLVDADTSPEVFIPDAGLRAAIRFELNLVEGDAVTEQKMQQLTHLAAPGGTEEKIADLTGLEHAVNLTFLTLGFNEIVDISPLGNLTSLTDLNLGFNEIV